MATKVVCTCDQCGGKIDPHKRHWQLCARDLSSYGGTSHDFCSLRCVAEWAKLNAGSTAEMTDIEVRKVGLEEEK